MGIKMYNSKNHLADLTILPKRVIKENRGTFLQQRFWQHWQDASCQKYFHLTNYCHFSFVNTLFNYSNHTFGNLATWQHGFMKINKNVSKKRP